MLLSLIVSVFNEEGGLTQFYEKASAVLRELSESREALCYEMLFVDDGSTDRSGDLLSELRKKDPEHVTVLSFSRNFGHEAAMTAGLDYASGDVLIFMDADLQHPPDLIPDILDKIEEGYEIVNMARTKNESAGLIKNVTSRAFYGLVNILSDMHMEPPHRISLRWIKRRHPYFGGIIVKRYASSGAMCRTSASGKPSYPMRRE